MSQIKHYRSKKEATVMLVGKLSYLIKGTYMMEYLTVKEMGERWNISSRMVTIYCKKGRIPRAIKKGNLWLLPSNAEKPVDNRKNNGRK